MNNPYNNDPFGQQGPVVIPPQGDPQGMNPSGGAVSDCTILSLNSIIFC